MPVGVMLPPLVVHRIAVANERKQTESCLPISFPEEKRTSIVSQETLLEEMSGQTSRY
jgi:hypothetical protein